MRRAMTVFQLGRMRHLDLLAHWCLLHPDTSVDRAAWAARLSKERLVTTILGSR